MKRIAVISAYQKAFIQRDVEMLSTAYQAQNYLFGKKDIATLKNLIQSLKTHDCCIFWFADFLAFCGVLLCRMLKKKVIVIVGGYELAAIPELNYGGLIKPFSKWRLKRILRLADKTLFVDESLQREAEKLMAKTSLKFLSIPTGFDDEFFQACGEKKDVILTVTTVSTIEIAKLKGLDSFVEAAQFFPQMKFRIVGIEEQAKSWLQAKSAENVEFIGILTQEELKKQYQEAKIYCQLSLREGLPNSLCEAMLSECIPVGSNVNGIPKAIGKTGVLWKNRSLDSLKNSLEEALQMRTGKQARERILNHFSWEKRKESLIEVIENLC
jgi:glycosyltransferase involved in cell wall biosynthesis